MPGPASASSDRLLWATASVVAAMALAWLLIDPPWSGGAEPPTLPRTGAAVAEDVAAAASPPPSADAASDLAGAAPEAVDPLHLARLALAAGMLIEPPEYNAWTLFGAAADADPDDAEAAQGLAQVAAALLGRGRTALEQGRIDDADTIAATIVDRFPQDAGALALAGAVVAARTPPPPPEPAPAGDPAVAAPAAGERVAGLSADFHAAMGRNAVLAPAGASARDIVASMLALAPEHELTLAARGLIVTEMLDRSVQSLEALDAVAAQTWIDSAAPLAVDPGDIARAQERLTRMRIEAESRKLLPATALEQIVDVRPQYPPAALNREIEGWVELEFIVSTAGKPEAIEVVAASHARYFREEAVAAVAQWRFEPVVFLGQPIPQRAHTRLAFVLD